MLQLCNFFLQSLASYIILRNAIEILGMLKEKLGVTSNVEVAKALKTSNANISNYVKRNKFPLDKLADVCVRKKWSFDELVGLEFATTTKQVEELELKEVEYLKEIHRLNKKLEEYQDRAIAGKLGGGDPQHQKRKQ